MAKMGRPKKDNPTSRVISFKVKESEYHLIVEYCQAHNISVSQLIRMGVEMKMNESKE